ncbi:MAG: hypothetical protein FWG64_02205 [Firmicutes bacterium]|nr:hypothetical protein [Bacillota bacterium]
MKTIAIFPLIMGSLTLMWPFSANAMGALQGLQRGRVEPLSFALVLVAFSIPTVGFYILAAISGFGKIGTLATILLTLLWTVLGVPISWFVAVIVDQEIGYIGVELFF